MTNKPLKFSVFTLVLGNARFGLNEFNHISPTFKDPYTITKDDGSVETLGFFTITKEVIAERFIFFTCVKGNKFPYPSKVTRPDLTEDDNPRKPEEMEPEVPWYVLIDIKNQRLYISDVRQKKEFENWLVKQMTVDVSIRAVIGREDFIRKLKKINTLSFRITPTLVTSASSDTLTSELSKTISGFGATKGWLELKFHEKFDINDEFRKRLGRLAESGDFDEYSLVGLNDDNMESILNIGEVINKLSIYVPTSEPYQELDSHDVMTILIREIELHDR